MYDAMLGGQRNFSIDREALAALTAIDPQVRNLARANRAFLGRAVRFLVDAGVRQFIDLGSGIPTQGNVHDVAQAAGPDSRVVYVDNDPVAVAHSAALLADNPNADILDADIRRPADILSSPQVRKLIDFDRPVAVLMITILHFVTSDEDPAGIVTAFRDALPDEGWLALSHATNKDRPDTAAAVGQLYRARAGSPVTPPVPATRSSASATASTSSIRAWSTSRCGARPRTNRSRKSPRSTGCTPASAASGVRACPADLESKIRRHPETERLTCRHVTFT